MVELMNWRDPYPEMGPRPMQDAYGPKSVLRGEETQTTISSAIEMFDAHLKELGECIRHLEMIHDRINGSGPQEVRSVNDMMDSDKVPHSLISSIHMRRNSLATSVKALEKVTRDLEQSI